MGKQAQRNKKTTWNCLRHRHLNRKTLLMFNLTLIFLFTTGSLISFSGCHPFWCERSLCIILDSLGPQEHVMERGLILSFPFEIMDWFYTGRLMRCVILSKQMVLILSEYLVSVRVVDYSSLGLLSENKIEKETVRIGKYVLASLWDRAERANRQGKQWQELKPCPGLSTSDRVSGEASLGSPWGHTPPYPEAACKRPYSW